MAIEKGKEWGEPGTLDASAFVASSDAQAADQVPTSSPIGLSAGDLARTLGARSPIDFSSPKRLLPIDTLSIETDNGAYVAVAHVVVGRLHLDAAVVALMNAAFVGDLNLAPRAHPGDGKIDVVSMELSLADRFKARTRMRTGTHVPHPGITIRRKTNGFLEFPRAKPVRVDGVLVGRSRSLRFALVPDALTVAV